MKSEDIIADVMTYMSLTVVLALVALQLNRITLGELRQLMLLDVLYVRAGL